MQLSLARNFAKGIDPGKRAWIPLAEASTVPAKIRIINLGRHQVQLPARQNVCLCMLDMLRGPGTTGGVTTGSKLVIRGIPPTAMGACPGQGSVRDHGLNLFRTSLQMDTYLAEGGFPMSPFSKSASGFSADTSAISGASRRCPSEWS